MSGRFTALCLASSLGLGLAACGDDDVTPFDPATAERVAVDRFSAEAGMLFVRDGSNGLPAANAPIDFDQAPFITTGLGPSGQVVQYYNFDVQPTRPAPIFVLFREGESTPVEGQLNIIDVIPGDEGYNDFWHVHKVTVPADYVANTVASVTGISAEGYPVEATDILVNCPVVPDGSTATKRLGGGNTGLVQGWYRNQVVTYFSFEEKALTTTPSNPTVPLSPIYVSFNINPDQTGGGPASGFRTETGTDQTHNVVATVPSDEDYSPLWLVNAYDNADFDSVSNLTTAMAATILGSGIAMVNCPIVDVQQ
jgi:hypothetical protein